MSKIYTPLPSSSSMACSGTALLYYLVLTINFSKVVLMWRHHVTKAATAHSCKGTKQSFVILIFSVSLFLLGSLEVIADLTYVHFM
jgi:hypothetical protein